MNKKFNHYILIWGIMLAVFVIAAVVASVVLDIESKGFFFGFIGVALAYLAEIACARKVFAQDSLQKFFYNIPILQILHGSLFLITVLGSACMLIPQVPDWTGAVVCLFIAAVTAIAVTKASAAAEIVSEIDEKVAASTESVKKLRTEAASLSALAQDSETKNAVKKIEELLRYADPVSSPKTAGLEAQIAVRLADLKDMLVKKADTASIRDLCGKLETLILERNNIAKASK